jgi:hypothetical protein
MSENLQRLSSEYRAFYEVLPYYVVVEEGHGSPTATKHMIRAGFDVDVHGFAKKGAAELPLPADYSLAYRELKKIANTISHDAGECSIDVISFPATSFSDARDHFSPQALLKIRISHCRGVDQPAGLPEEHALEQVEKELQRLGIKKR